MANLLGDASRVTRDAQGGCTPVQRLSTLSGLSFSVLFILMRDKREPTPTNPSGSGAHEGTADRLPVVLAARLRAARQAVGLSQGAVAKLMNERGFSWRQTTVAKSEAADRPVLFSEVVALAQIYRRAVDYFVYAGTGLDDVLDQAATELASVEAAYEQTQVALYALENDRALFAATVGLATSIRRYRDGADSGVLMDELHELARTWGSDLLQQGDVFEAVGVSMDDVKRADRKAVEVIAQHLNRQYQRLTEEQLREESPQMLLEVSDFLEGKEVSEALLDVLRGDPSWASNISLFLTDLLVDAVDVTLPH
ncbi:helix-turn-helix domain-containing protein [Streptomyces sp. NPDC090073]|uniref:helix-turn-helix domain-containing protein n=1 Tax=Streptomyces sp. NPDC090073 TaxID=3365936 RepID=UPI00381FDB3F